MKLLKARKSFLLAISLVLIALAVTACTSATEAQPKQTVAAAEYHSITPEDAKALIDSGDPVTVLDVREQSEYDAGHIAGAVLLPSGSVKGLAAETLPDKNAKIIVYCRSGARSEVAARTLVDLGYTQVYDMGGLMNWPYDVVTN